MHCIFLSFAYHSELPILRSATYTMNTNSGNSLRFFFSSSFHFDFVKTADDICSYGSCAQMLLDEGKNGGGLSLNEH